MEIKNILISGGAGFIGSNLAIKLVSEGYNVTVLDNLSKQIHGEDPLESDLYLRIRDKVNFIKGDVTIRNDWERSLAGQDAVIHLAAETGTGQSMYEIEKYTRTNILGTALLWELISDKKNRICKVIVASSRAIYGEGKYLCTMDGIVYPFSRKEEDMKNGDFNVKCPHCGVNVKLLATTEDSAIHPTSIYGFTKQAQEELSMIAGKSLGIPVVAFRYQNVYGPGQSLSNPYTGILSIFSTRLLNDNAIHVFEDGKESRDFVYVDDVINATILGLKNDNANFKSFNVGTGQRTDVLTIANMLRVNLEKNVEIAVTGNFRLGDIRDNYADISLIRNTLGFEPLISFAEGISKFTSWVQKQNVRHDSFLKSIEEMKEKGLFK